uniref:Secreted protein n=1 Tax=Steinernema glaseri TaxID=37863 RepID=A0A1I8AQC8_9BILA
MALYGLLIFITLVPFNSARYVDSVIPSGLIEKDEAPQTRAARLDANVRLLTALSLQQQIKQKTTLCTCYERKTTYGLDSIRSPTTWDRMGGATVREPIT